jgi:hypothetical protein
VGDATKRLLAVIFATAAYPAVKMEKDVGLLAGLLREHCGAEITARFLLASEPDLGT